MTTRLQSSGYTNVDFVGTLSGQGCGVSYDSDGEGHGGYLAPDIANQNQLPDWLSATRPDVVVMHRAQAADRGSYTVSGLGSRKQAVLNTGGTVPDLAIAMPERIAGAGG